MEKDTSLERLAAAICPIVLDALRGLAAHPEDRDAAWEMEGNVLSSIMEAAAAAYAQALEAGIRAPHTASLTQRAQGAEEAREAEAEGDRRIFRRPCDRRCASIRRQGLRISCPGPRRDARRRGPVQVGRLARGPGGLPAHKRLTPSPMQYRRELGLAA
jgi:hypothetical protein